MLRPRLLGREEPTRKVFISHSTRDDSHAEEVLERVISGLKGKDYDVFVQHSAPSASLQQLIGSKLVGVPLSHRELTTVLTTMTTVGRHPHLRDS
jgi:hypothetical protein